MDRQISPLEALDAWTAMAKGAYPKNTLRAWKADGAIFQAFCEGAGLRFFPAEPQTIRQFVQHCLGLGKKPATIRRYLATIARAHRAAGLASPCASEPVRLALKAMALSVPERQRQARALGWQEISRFLELAGDSLRDLREKTLLCVAYDTMARRAELVALNVEDIHYAKDGSGTAVIRRSKTDQAGEGASAYLAPDTVRNLQAWLKDANLRQGALFRRVHRDGTLGERLGADIVADVFKRVAERIGLPADHVAAVSGHSIRVGATQDLLALNIDLASVMQSGRWKSSRMPMRYGEQVMAARGGISRAAKAQGRY